MSEKQEEYVTGNEEEFIEEVIKATETCIKAVEPLDQKAKARVLLYLKERFSI